MVVIIEVFKIILYLIKSVRTGVLKNQLIMIELKKIIQILVLVTITIVEIQMDQINHGVTLWTQMIDGSIVMYLNVAVMILLFKIQLMIQLVKIKLMKLLVKNLDVLS
jgi:hypothetical protein